MRRQHQQMLKQENKSLAQVHPRVLLLPNKPYFTIFRGEHLLFLQHTEI